MTDEKRIKSIISECEYGYISYDNMHNDNEHGIRLIEQALEKQIKYQWHDLRKNPKDLPNYDQRVEICIELKSCNYRSYDFGTYQNFKNGDEWYSDDFVTLKDVIAWREIEPFEEEKE